MCGITAALLSSPDQFRAAHPVATRAAALLRHRGPDWSGDKSFPLALLYHERLSVVGAGDGAQPIVDEDIALTVNGEIFNHKEIRAEIPSFKTASDCEAILRLYIRDVQPVVRARGASSQEAVAAGAAALSRLRGQFAFVLHDAKLGVSWIARDAIGITCLYWGVDEAGVVWVASELKALSEHCQTLTDFPPGHHALHLHSDDAHDPSSHAAPTGTASAASEGEPTPEHVYVPPSLREPATEPSAHAIAPAAGDRGTRTTLPAVFRWYAPMWFDPAYFPVATAEDTGTATAFGERAKYPAALLASVRASFERAVARRMMSDVPWGVLLSGGLDSSLVAAVATKFSAARVEDDGKSSAWWPRVHSFSIGLEGSPDLAAARSVAKHLDTVHHEFTFTLKEGLDAVSHVVRAIETYDVTTIRASTPMYLLSRRIKAMGVKMVLSGEGADEMFGGYLYMHKAPSAEEFHAETVRKIKALHKYDCQRANKSTMAWGLEARVPFLDTDFLDLVMTMPAVHKMASSHPDGARLEKHVLRTAFAPSSPQERPILPLDVLFRQKEQFSDGVGYGWIDALRDTAVAVVSDEALASAASRFPVNPPRTKEAYMYRAVFERVFPHPDAAALVPGGPSIACSTADVMHWDATFAASADPSGRAVSSHNSALVSAPGEQ